jgi:hypothetical protein
VETVTEASPRRIEMSLLVVEEFKDRSGTEWRPGDRAPLVRRAIRQAALENPQWFRVEFETLPLDPSAEWFCEIDARYEEQYQQVKRHRDGAEERRQRALREELEAQDHAPGRGQRDLERRYKQQEREREESAKRAREDRERWQIENELQFRSGFNV